MIGIYVEWGWTMNLIKIILYLSPFFLCAVVFWILTDKWILLGQQPKANGENEYAIILGARVAGEIPTRSLQYRLDSALQYALRFPHVKLILSGGQGPGEDISEAKAMEKFLLKNGVEEGRLLLEPASTSTYENIHYSIRLIPDVEKGVTIITSDYHVARARMIAERFGFHTDAIVAKTPQVVEKRLKNRERLALLKTILLRK